MKMEYSPRDAESVRRACAKPSSPKRYTGLLVSCASRADTGYMGMNICLGLHSCHGEIQLSLELSTDFVVPQNFFGTFASVQCLNVALSAFGVKVGRSRCYFDA
jgi:hypothetical protein